MSRVFFTDRDLGKRFPEILSSAGLQVERHLDHFAHDCPDTIWLEEIGRRGWTAVTHDGRIRYKPNELAAVVQHRVGLLVVIGHAPYPALAHSFVATKDRIINHFWNDTIRPSSPRSIGRPPHKPLTTRTRRANRRK